MPRDVALFQPLALRSVTVPGRAWVSPMCMYSCDAADTPGVVTDWHLMHYGQFAAGGAPLIITEATAVVPEGRISPEDAGLWNDDQTAAWRRVTDLVHGQTRGDGSSMGAVVVCQLAHAGRKASTFSWRGDQQGTVPVDEGGWQTVGPTGDAFDGLAAPHALTDAETRAVVTAFGDAAERAVAAGFDGVEVHAAHGYLLHQFLSPLVNTRDDAWGGDEAGRHALGLAVVREVRARVGDEVPVLLRVSATDWADTETDLADIGRFCAAAVEAGVDMIDVSSGGNLGRAPIVPGPGYQLPFAQAIAASLAEAGVEAPVGTVGEITDARQAETIVGQGQADVVLLARAALADPHWWYRAAHTLGHGLEWVGQYRRTHAASVY